MGEEKTLDTGIMKTLDNLVNFLPRGAAKRIMGKGEEGLAYAIPAALGYFTICAAQGVALGYAVNQMGGSTTESVVASVVATATPPVMWLTSFFRGLKKFND